MRITVLGKSPAWQDAGGACSGYLVEADGLRLLLDCGCGVFGKLRGHREYWEVDAVVISHLHADHILDLVPYASALTYAPRQQPVPVGGHPGTDTPARPRLIAPAGAAEAFRRVCAGAGMRAEHVEHAFELTEYAPEDTFELGPLSLRFRPVPHFLPTNAVELREGDARLTFSADSRAQRRAVRVRARHLAAADRGHAAAARARGAARAPHPGRGRRARPPRRRAAARAHALLRRARRGVGARRGERGVRRARRRRPRGRRLRALRSSTAFGAILPIRSPGAAC